MLEKGKGSLGWTYVVGEIGVHEDDVVAGAGGQAFDVGRTQAELARSRMQLQLVAVDFLQLSNDVLGAIGGVVVDDDDLHVDVVLLGRLEEEVCNDGEVLPLLVSGHQHRVLVAAASRFHHFLCF